MSKKEKNEQLLEQAYLANKTVRVIWKESVILRRVRVLAGYYVTVLDYKNRKITGYDDALNAFIVGDPVRDYTMTNPPKKGTPKRTYNKGTLSGEKRVNLTVRIDPAIKSAIKTMKHQSLSSKMEDFFIQELNMETEEILKIYNQSKKTE